jgi:hypothetical protein
MPKDSKPSPKPSESKGKTKRERHSATTTANKLRGMRSRENRLQRAAERRRSRDYIYPDGKHQGKKTRRGTTVHRESMIRREQATHRIFNKREQRRNFKRLSPAQKSEHRIAGSEHRRPRLLKFTR